MKHGWAAVLAVWVGTASAQNDIVPPPSVPQKEVDEAVARGVAWLKKNHDPSVAKDHSASFKNANELVLLTLIHSGLGESNALVKKLLDDVMGAELEKTYKVALQAMCLEELDRVKYQARIAQCAQFLVDCQAKNGQWSYGNPTTYPKDLKEMVASGVGKSEPEPKRTGFVMFGGEREKPKVRNRLIIKKQKDGPASGDNSNTQYGALGMRACHDAGIVLPEETIRQAYQWLVESQHADELKEKAGDKKAVASGMEAGVRGWSYKGADDDKDAYHAMTAGGLGAVVIYDYIMGRDWKKDRVAIAGYNWLGKHFATNQNYYYMYGLERAGMLYATEVFGRHNWYLEGARKILDWQADDGRWGNHQGDDKPKDVWDTCFAILFLKKATRAIATEAAGGRR